jgi:hypothetical protein
MTGILRLEGRLASALEPDRLQGVPMTRLLPTLAAVAVLAASFAAVPGPSRAGPEMSEYSDRLDVNLAACVKRARWAFGQEGWTGITPGDQHVIDADKGRLSGMIVCLGGDVTDLGNGVFDEDSIAVIVVTGGDSGQAEAASAALKKDVFGK